MSRLGIAIGLLAATCTAALADEVDVLLARESGAALGTGAIDTVGGGLALPVRIFSEELFQLPGVDDIRDDEGFFAVSDPNLLPDGYEPLAGGATLTFAIRAFMIDGVTANAWFWDPAADPDVSFAPLSGGVTLTMQKSPTAFFKATAAGESTDIAGFTIDVTSGSGSLHKHLEIVVDDADSSLATPIPTGVYLIALTVSDGVRETPPFFEVINGNLGAAGEQAVGDAIAFVEGLLEPDCPGDVDGDGLVGNVDLQAVLDGWATHTGDAGYDPAADFNHDGTIGNFDLQQVLDRWAQTCP